MNMKIVRAALGVALLALTFGAMAQGGPGAGPGGGAGGRRGGGQGMMMRGGGGDLMLLGREDVQGDLKITADQKAKIEAMQNAQREEMRDMMQKMRENGGQPDPGAMREMMDKSQKASDAKIKEILTAEQYKRLKEIAIQLAGVRALFQPEVQKQLDLSVEQKNAIAKLQEKQRTDQQELMTAVRNGDLDREEMQSEMKKINDNIEKELDAVLKADQKEKLKAMGGAPFKASAQTGRARGGGAPGGAPGN